MVTREARVTTRWLWSVLLHNDDQRFGGIEEIASLRYCKHYGREWSAKTKGQYRDRHGGILHRVLDCRAGLNILLR
uniref:Uncharacterized protein n=1 Tax=Hyaloperonospora arabidopsidis (strain Emoy2) TaxID=559515 RepID=M4BFP5_HYAAE